MTGPGREVADQLWACHCRADQHRGLIDTRLGTQAGFDFFGLDAETAQLDLLVEAPQVLQHAIGTPTRAVTGTVQTCPRLPQGVGDETFGRQPRPPQVTPGKANTADAQFTRHATGHRVEMTVQHTAHHVAQGPANR
ncbi:hypothetical protein D3C76_867790 [compost metagenome]